MSIVKNTIGTVSKGFDNFEVNSNYKDSDLGSIASYANNAWTVFNNIVSGEEQSEINRSAFLAL